MDTTFNGHYEVLYSGLASNNEQISLSSSITNFKILYFLIDGWQASTGTSVYTSYSLPTYFIEGYLDGTLTSGNFLFQYIFTNAATSNYARTPQNWWLTPISDTKFRFDCSTNLHLVKVIGIN